MRHFLFPNSCRHALVDQLPVNFLYCNKIKYQINIGISAIQIQVYFCILICVKIFARKQCKFSIEKELISALGTRQMLMCMTNVAVRA